MSLENLSMIKTAKPFSHIYIEKKVEDHPRTMAILAHYPHARRITIDKYTDVFHRPRQNFMTQKQSQQLILAEKQQDFYYRGSPLCEDFGHRHFYYTTQMMNCPFNCSYCYLKSLYPAAHLVVFVNSRDTFEAIEKTLLPGLDAPPYLAISYDCDLLSMNRITGFFEEWIDFAGRHPEITIEIKTKIGHYSGEPLPPNLILAWSLLPQGVIDLYEQRTPSLNMRLSAIKKALSADVSVRLSIEPILPIADGEHHYRHFINTLAQNIDLGKIYDVNIGGFRLSKKQYKAFVKVDPTAQFFAHPFGNHENTMFFPENDKLIAIVSRELEKMMDGGRIRCFGEI